METVAVHIIDDGNPEPSETFLGQLSSADGVVIPPNVLLQPNRATATIINENGTLTELHNIIMCDSNSYSVQISLLNLQRMVVPSISLC